MGLGDLILCVFLPFLASGVRGRGAGAVLGVLILWFCLWLPGSIAGFILQLTYHKPTPAVVPVVNVYNQAPPPTAQD